MKSAHLLAGAVAFALIAGGCGRQAPTGSTQMPAATTTNTPAGAVIKLSPGQVTNTTILSSGGSVVVSDAVAWLVDLTASLMVRATNFEQIARQPFTNVPTGTKTFAGVPLQIDGFLCLSGGGTTKAGNSFPKEVKGIAVAGKFDALYLYHAAFYQSPDGTPITHVVFQYADGTTLTNDIRYGVHARDWFEMPGEEVHGVSDPKSAMVWPVPNTTKPGPDNFVRLFLTEMANPKPGVPVTAIDLVSTEEEAGSVVFGITTGRRVC